MSYLIVKWRGEEVDRFELTSAVVIGRDFGCQIWLNDPTLSRRHCEISPAGCGTWMIVDLDSRNGVTVDEREVKRRVLKDGQVIRVGDAQITFCEEAVVTRRPATPQEAIEQAMMRSKKEFSRGGAAPALAATKVSPHAAPAKTKTGGYDPLCGNGLAFQRPPAKPQIEADESAIASADANVPTDPSPGRGAFGSILRALLGKRDVA